ncbi:MAG: hypothetical protein V5B34_11020 [Accumulibacter sp.]|jgi:hypothetical protein
MGKASRRKVAARTRELLNATQSRLKASGLSPPLVIRNEVPPEQKISYGISTILDSEVGEDASLDEYRHRAKAIVLAWNVSLLPLEEQANTLKQLGEFARQTDPGGAAAAQAELLRLIEKKRLMFPDDKRFIVSCDLQLVGNKVHVTAAAILAPAQPSATS